jgi:hypothetical protein
MASQCVCHSASGVVVASMFDAVPEKVRSRVGSVEHRARDKRVPRVQFTMSGLIAHPTKPWLFRLAPYETDEKDRRALVDLLERPDARLDTDVSFTASLVHTLGWTRSVGFNAALGTELLERFYSLDLTDDTYSVEDLLEWSKACPNLRALVLYDVRIDKTSLLEGIFPRLRQLVLLEASVHVASVLLTAMPQLVSFVCTPIDCDDWTPLYTAMTRHPNLKHVAIPFPCVVHSPILYVESTGEFPHQSAGLSRDKASFGAALATFALAGTRATQGHPLRDCFVADKGLLHQLTELLRPTERRDLALIEFEREALRAMVEKDERAIAEHGKTVLSKLSWLTHESRYGKSVCCRKSQKRKIEHS